MEPGPQRKFVLIGQHAPEDDPNFAGDDEPHERRGLQRGEQEYRQQGECRGQHQNSVRDMAHQPTEVLCSPPRRAARVLPSPTPLGSQCGGCSSLPTPGPLRSTRGHARLRRVLRSCSPACPSSLPAGGEERLDRPDRNIQDQEGDTIMAICAPCRVPRGVEQCEDTQACRCGVARACCCQHKTHSGKPAAVSPGSEGETPTAENGTGCVGAIGHTAGNEGRTP